MNYSEYLELVDELLNSDVQQPPYDNEMYLSYTKLNRSRMKRWDKHLILDEQLIIQLKNINTPQHWIIISEPWCGDAAHILPFLIQMTMQNDLITYDIQLRDSEPFLIQSYLTNGSMSIPKLVVRDEQGKDLFTWGPRPKEAQDLVDELKASKADFEATKVALQHWYNEDKGSLLCKELIGILKGLNSISIR